MKLFKRQREVLPEDTLLNQLHVVDSPGHSVPTEFLCRSDALVRTSDRRSMLNPRSRLLERGGGGEDRLLIAVAADDV